MAQTRLHGHANSSVAIAVRIDIKSIVHNEGHVSRNTSRSRSFSELGYEPINFTCKDSVKTFSHYLRLFLVQHIP